MSEQPQYTNAPITEAVIDIRAGLPAGAETESLRQLYETESSVYPTLQNVQQLKAELSTGDEVSTTTRQQLRGYVFKSEDDSQIVQVRRDGFTFSRLAPYRNWGEMRDEARRLWDRYRATAQPESIERVAVRYINRIDIPQESASLEDYFLTYPEISAELPQHMRGFFLRTQLFFDDIKSALTLSQAQVAPAKPKSISIVLDIDLFRESDVPQEDNELWAFLEVLHTYKNSVFEGCITDKTRELIA